MCCVLDFVYFAYFIDIPPCNSVRLSYWNKGYLLTYLLTLFHSQRQQTAATLTRHSDNRTHYAGSKYSQHENVASSGYKRELLLQSFLPKL